jgi:hypothetical protein
MLAASRQQSIRSDSGNPGISVCGRPYYAAAILYPDTHESKHSAGAFSGGSLA